VDNAGRFREEVLGNDLLTKRSYYADKQRPKTIVTEGPTLVQSLGYEYDAHLNLKRRSDGLQPQSKNEHFRYDALNRLTCAYFSADENPFAPCATSYAYEPNGNMTFKADVGVLSYDDPAHPHAVTSAGGDSFGYDAVGNQVTRPGGVAVTYTGFDLPKVIKQGALTLATFGYDGDQRRIRKTTADEETLYFGDLYERVTAKKGAAKTEHRYFITSPERVVAVVTRGGDTPGIRYVHVDHLGSVEKLTDEKGAVVEKRSYDVYGQRRNPVWGQPPPASFASKTTLGFTGHEHDDELGLVNMRGRLMDPKLGRFLTTDPIVADLFSGQSLNPYSYVLGNPLAYVDPSGFQASAGLLSQPGDVVMPMDHIEASHTARVALYLTHQGPPPSEPSDMPSNAADLGAAAPAADVDTTGSSSEHDPQAMTTAPDEGFEGSTIVRGGLGFSYGVGQAWLPGGYFVPSAQPQDFAFEFWRGAGQFTAGVIEVVAGVALVGGGGAAAGGGIAGAVPTGGASLLVTGAGGSAVTAGWAAVGHGTTSIVAGLATIADSLSLSTGAGSGSSGQQAPPASKPGVDYRETFFRAHPQLRGQVVVHHAIEQQVLKRYPGLFTEKEIHALNNLRGVPKSANPDLHLSQIRRSWNEFYRTNPNATKQQILDFAANIDAKFGSTFFPPR
jgi:RHS repeat-associated protein